MSNIVINVVLRFVLGGFAVAASAFVARKLGGRIGGIFAAFPAVYLSAAIAVGVAYSGKIADKAVFEISQGAFIGMAANIFCAAAAAYLIPRHKWHKGLLYSILLWFIVACVLYWSAFFLGLMR